MSPPKKAPSSITSPLEAYIRIVFALSISYSPRNLFVIIIFCLKLRQLYNTTRSRALIIKNRMLFVVLKIEV